MVLLDLGLWDDPDESWRSSVKSKPSNREQAQIVYQQLRHFTSRLSFYVGECYTEAVQNCLSDRCFDVGSDEETIRSFINKVLDKIHGGEGL